MSKEKIVKETKLVTKFRGVCAAARYLGVSRVHLSFVLHGQRKPGAALAKRLGRMGVEIGKG
jgi:plasmid maintenance system antidote protein VapI